MADPKALVAGNWKMNGLTAQLKEVRLLADMLKGVRLGCDVMVCPPNTLIRPVLQLLGSSRIEVGGQDCHNEATGAYTGDISAEMLADAGCVAVIVGHSERRARHCETDALVRAKAEAAHRAGLTAIVCIGETLEEREAGPDAGRGLGLSSPHRCPKAQQQCRHRHCLRAGLGHRHRPHADAWARSRRSIARSAASSSQALGEARAGGADPLWRLGQARQCRRTPRGEMSMARWSAAPA